jgi:transcription-repair coupling factor (superfamily II helicase)
MINSKQVVLISPLIVLAYEHYEKALERFVKFPFNIEVLTRFENQTRVKNTLERLKT